MRQAIRTISGQIIGYADTDSVNKDKMVMTQNGVIVGWYRAKQDRTLTFSGQLFGQGDQTLALLYQELDRQGFKR